MRHGVVKVHRTGKQWTSLVCVAALLQGCAITEVEYPDEIIEEMPVQTPVRAVTGFTDGLHCMDQMFLKYKVRPIRVTAAQIPDFSESRGDASYGAREMLISAISTMSQQSGALRFVAYDRSTPDIIALQSAHPNKKDFLVPDFFIRGAVTQIQSSPYSRQNGYSLSANGIDEKEIQGGQASNSNSASLSTVSVDLNMGLINNFQLLPGIFASNSLSVEKRSSSDDVSLSIWKLGAIYSLNDSRAEPLSGGLRALMEVGAMEMFGKLYNLPYWECLGTLGDDNEVAAAARETYDDQDDDERMEWIAGELARQKYLARDVPATREDGEMSDALRAAISHYRVKNDMFGNTMITFNMFKKLYAQLHMASKEVSQPSSIESDPTQQGIMTTPAPEQVTQDQTDAEVTTAQQ
jgi:hypothetical protein